MAKELLTERQRREIEDYLDKQPNTMPQYIRSLRNLLKKINYEQMEEDLALMKRLSQLDVPMGRKRNDWSNLKAGFKVRQTGKGDVKGTFGIKDRK